MVSFSAEPTWLGIFCKMNEMMYLIKGNADQYMDFYDA